MKKEEVKFREAFAYAMEKSGMSEISMLLGGQLSEKLNQLEDILYEKLTENDEAAVDTDDTEETEVKYLYAKNPFVWRRTPNGSWDEHCYPAGTKVKVIGSGMRGYDVEICETGVVMCETGLMEWIDKPIN